MNSMVFFAIAVYGLTVIIVQSKILKGFREFFKTRIPFIYSLLTCMMCTGFWVSLGASFLIPISEFWLLDAAFGVGVIWFIHSGQLYLENNSGEEL